MKKTEKPVVTKQDGPMEGEKITHPSFALVSASRISGSAVLYDSDFLHQNFVRLTIKRSQLNRTLSNNWHFEREELISVDMSEAQWATFVSSMNVGSGVPCTLGRFNGESVPGLEAPLNSVEKFKLERDETMQEGLEALKEMAKTITESKLSKKEKEALLWNIEQTSRGFGSSLKFVADQFGEFMEKTQEKAKIEINAYATSTLQRMGLEKASEFLKMADESGLAKETKTIEDASNSDPISDPGNKG